MLTEFEQQVMESAKPTVPIIDGAVDPAARIAELTKLLENHDLEEYERDSIWREIALIKLQQNTVNVAELLTKTPVDPDQIIADTVDVADKMVIIAPSKLKKSFFLLQLLICLAAGRDFLRLHVPKPRRVVHIQLEIQSNHFHKRVLKIAKSLGIVPSDLGDRFHVINCRGLGVEGVEGIGLVEEAVKIYQPEILSFDPLYKIAAGGENDIEAGKVILGGFDRLMESTGAAVAFIHHDPKGAPGDRDIRDRGAGSNILSRDYDACITLTPHISEKDAVVVETMVRNYPPQEPFTVLWVENKELDSYGFVDRPDILPNVKTSKTRTPAPALAKYLPAATSILGVEEIELPRFKEQFKNKTGLSDNRIREFMAWATSGGSPNLSYREIWGKGVHKKWVKVK